MTQKAILFDLDGTLLPIDTDQFIKKYMYKLGQHANHLLPADQMLKYIWHGTEAMIANTDPDKTNAEVFEQHFLAASGLDKHQAWPTFDQFYEEVFPDLSTDAASTPLARLIVEEAVGQGYAVAVATNPLFPEIAIRERMRWAGIDDLPFQVVTAYEQSHFCKPHPQYFQEICEKLGVKPTDSIMAGNDMQEDMAAAKTGMKTYWVTDFAIDRGEPVYPVGGKGSLTQLYDDLKHKKGIFSE